MVKRKSCKKGYSRNRSTGRCRKISRKSRVSRFVDNAERGNCRGRRKNVCNSDPNCTYRKRVGCVKRRGAKKAPFFGPMMPDSGY